MKNQVNSVQELIIPVRIKENIFIRDLPEKILSEILQVNTFVNPVYESNEQYGYSNWNVEPFIKTYRQNDEGLILPLGYGAQLLKFLKENCLDTQLDDQRSVQPTKYLSSLKGITLRPYQERAINAALNNVQGVIVSPTGSGKSLIGLEIIRRRQQKALIILHRKDLADQWVKVIKKQLDIDSGYIGDGKWNVGAQITIALMQTLASRSEEAHILADAFGLILVDEAHHVPAEAFFAVLGIFSARYRYALTATLERRDGLMPMIFLAIGPQIASVGREEVEHFQATVPTSVKVIKTGCAPKEANSWHEFLDAICTNADRNLLILKLATNSNAPTLILCDRVAHAEELSGMFFRRTIDHVLVHGQLKNRDEAMGRIKNSPITIGTTGLLGEGLDVPFWEVLIMASPISSEIKLMQAIGRVVRAIPGKKKALVYDLRDDCGFAGASFKKRFKIFKRHKILVSFDDQK